MEEPFLCGVSGYPNVAGAGVAVDIRQVFSGRGGGVFLQGFLRKGWCSAWCFRGEFVVDRGANVERGGRFFDAEKQDRPWKYF
jgi:hypothetical protein